MLAKANRNFNRLDMDLIGRNGGGPGGACRYFVGTVSFATPPM